jgi:dihydroflavonol-4-reductase
MSEALASMTLPFGRPVLVTGAGGFVGGHVARALAHAGYHVRGLARRTPPRAPGDPPIEWVIGDLREASTRERAVAGVRGVIHAASWVSLGADPRGESRAVNVEATRDLLERAAAAGVTRFVYTSTLWTVAAGTAAAPASEESVWNLECVRSPYSESKREAERLVLARNRPDFRTAVLCPGLVIGPRDVRPTSTRVLLEMARTPLAFVPNGGIPVIDAHVVALAHVRALERAEPGTRYVVTGSYLSYPELAALVARVAGRPWKTVVIPDILEGPLRRSATLAARLGGERWSDASAASVSGGFLHLHVSGARADAAFELLHPPPLQSVTEALEDHRRAGRLGK